MLAICEFVSRKVRAHRIIEQRHPSFPLFTETRAFVETALASEALKALATDMR